MTVASHDQTRGDSMPYLDDGRSASLSSNEVASLCLKAARGAGMSWGLAEEAGFAAVWLTEHGINGPRHLQAHLAKAQNRAWRDLCPTVTPDEWRAPPNRALCPIALGATLCDYAGLAHGIKPGAPLRIGKLDHPVLLIPFLMAIGASDTVLFDIEWTGGTLMLDGGLETLTQAATALDGRQVSMTLHARSGKPQAAKGATAPVIMAGTISALNSMAMRTTVPSSEHSRAGAGSSTTDND